MVFVCFLFYNFFWYKSALHPFFNFFFIDFTLMPIKSLQNISPERTTFWNFENRSLYWYTDIERARTIHYYDYCQRDFFFVQTLDILMILSNVVLKKNWSVTHSRRSITESRRIFSMSREKNGRGSKRRRQMVTNYYEGRERDTYMLDTI